MYASSVGDRVLHFGVSGLLYRDSLVMYDRETGSLWSQVDGRAIAGPLAGTRLAVVPSLHATWREWKATYPESVVLKKSGEFRTPYESYNRSGQLGLSRRALRDRRLPGKERILGIEVQGAARAYPVAALRAQRLVHDAVGGLAVVFVAQPTQPIVVFNRHMAGQLLAFDLAPGDPADALVDRQTGTRWRIHDGVAVEGPLRGQRLARVAAVPAFWFGWQAFFPWSSVWTPPGPPRP